MYFVLVFVRLLQFRSPEHGYLLLIFILLIFTVTLYFQFLFQLELYWNKHLVIVYFEY